MLYFIATKYGFMTAIDSRQCDRDVRMAYPFLSFEAADQAAKAVFGKTHFAILANCIG